MASADWGQYGRLTWIKKGAGDSAKNYVRIRLLECSEVQARFTIDLASGKASIENLGSNAIYISGQKLETGVTRELENDATLSLFGRLFTYQYLPEDEGQKLAEAQSSAPPKSPRKPRRSATPKPEKTAPSTPRKRRRTGSMPNILTTEEETTGGSSSSSSLQSLMGNVQPTATAPPENGPLPSITGDVPLEERADQLRTSPTGLEAAAVGIMTQIRADLAGDTMSLKANVPSPRLAEESNDAAMVAAKKLDVDVEKSDGLLAGGNVQCSMEVSYSQQSTLPAEEESGSGDVQVMGVGGLEGGVESPQEQVKDVADLMVPDEPAEKVDTPPGSKSADDKLIEESQQQSKQSGFSQPAATTTEVEKPTTQTAPQTPAPSTTKPSYMRQTAASAAKSALTPLRTQLGRGTATTPRRSIGFGGLVKPAGSAFKTGIPLAKGSGVAGRTVGTGGEGVVGGAAGGSGSGETDNAGGEMTPTRRFWAELDRFTASAKEEKSDPLNFGAPMRKFDKGSKVSGLVGSGSKNAVQALATSQKGVQQSAGVIKSVAPSVAERGESTTPVMVQDSLEDAAADLTRNETSLTETEELKSLTPSKRRRSTSPSRKRLSFQPVLTENTESNGSKDSTPRVTPSKVTASRLSFGTGQNDVPEVVIEKQGSGAEGSGSGSESGGEGSVDGEQSEGMLGVLGLKTPILGSAKGKKVVTFGPDLSPEIFRVDDAPSTPMKKGTTPNIGSAKRLKPLLKENTPLRMALLASMRGEDKRMAVLGEEEEEREEGGGIGENPFVVGGDEERAGGVAADGGLKAGKEDGAGLPVVEEAKNVEDSMSAQGSVVPDSLEPVDDPLTEEVDSMDADAPSTDIVEDESTQVDEVHTIEDTTREKQMVINTPPVEPIPEADLHTPIKHIAPPKPVSAQIHRSNPAIKQNLSSPTPARKGAYIGMKEMFNTPVEQRDASLVGVKELLKVPGQKKNRESMNLVGVKEMLMTPEVNDGDVNFVGVKEMMKTPAGKRESVNLVGVRELMKTPKPTEGDVNLVGVKEMMKTPGERTESLNLVGVKELMKTPGDKRQSVNLVGVKELMKTPAAKPDITNLVGVKEMLKTPGGRKESANFVGVKELLKPSAGPKDTPRVAGLKEMFQTPGKGVIGIQAEVVEGVNSLFKTPSGVEKESTPKLIVQDSVLSAEEADEKIEMQEVVGTPGRKRDGSLEPIVEIRERLTPEQKRAVRENFGSMTGTRLFGEEEGVQKAEECVRRGRREKKGAEAVGEAVQRPAAVDEVKSTGRGRGKKNGAVAVAEVKEREVVVEKPKRTGARGRKATEKAAIARAPGEAELKAAKGNEDMKVPAPSIAEPEPETEVQPVAIVEDEVVPNRSRSTRSKVRKGEEPEAAPGPVVEQPKKVARRGRAAEQTMEVAAESAQESSEPSTRAAPEDLEEQKIYEMAQKESPVRGRGRSTRGAASKAKKDVLVEPVQSQSVAANASEAAGSTDSDSIMDTEVEASREKGKSKAKGRAKEIPSLSFYGAASPKPAPTRRAAKHDSMAEEQVAGKRGGRVTRKREREAEMLVEEKISAPASPDKSEVAASKRKGRPTKKQKVEEREVSGESLDDGEMVEGVVPMDTEGQGRTTRASQRTTAPAEERVNDENGPVVKRGTWGRGKQIEKSVAGAEPSKQVDKVEVAPRRGGLRKAVGGDTAAKNDVIEPDTAQTSAVVVPPVVEQQLPATTPARRATRKRIREAVENESHIEGREEELGGRDVRVEEGSASQKASGRAVRSKSTRRVQIEEPVEEDTSMVEEVSKRKTGKRMRTSDESIGVVENEAPVREPVKPRGTRFKKGKEVEGEKQDEENDGVGAGVKARRGGKKVDIEVGVQENVEDVQGVRRSRRRG
ncbi:hypothetical protein HK097_003172 [Rhizophlyctis rosea]|uniref:PP1-binding domain-containing protein n=1 Tax=Rhizophlyctis rosea TaxID=64517 RepID=A0AAD5SF29_9FUNG|nr:hypothetical protein HK097_003172 [Rhizophlyctis rosea]